MLVAFICLIAGLMIGFLLSGILRAGAVEDISVALYLSQEDNVELRTQLHTVLMKALPYECGDGDGLRNSDEPVDLIDLGPDHEGPLRFIPNPVSPLGGSPPVR